MNYILKKVKELSPIEGYTEERIPIVKRYVIKNGYWLESIKIERRNLVLDGHHRFEMAKRMGLKRMPCVIFDYKDLDIYSLRENIIIKNKEEVIKNALKGNLYPSKTVKHIFPNGNYSCKIKLEELRK